MTPTRRFPFVRLIAILWAVSFAAPAARAQEAVPLISPRDAAAGWSFDNGREFPGATGGLTVDDRTRHDGRDSLKIVGDFTKGGNYVSAGRKIDAVDVRELSMWVRNPDADAFTLRINDTSGQTHQIVVKTEPGPDWQRVVLPLERFFARRGQADAVAGIAKYESWGGAKDGKWHGPATALYVLVGRSGPNETHAHTLWLGEVSILPRPSEVPGAEVKTVVRLDEILEGEHDWRFTRGEEFPGAKGAFSVVPEGAAGQPCLKLAGDFTGGGAYVAAVKELKDLKESGAKDVTAFRLRVKSDNASSVGVQIVDDSGQTHQRQGVPVTPDGQWHDLVLKPADVAGGEHWGGANDGKWHGPAVQFVISVTAGSDPKAKQPVLYLADVIAEALQPVFARPAAFKADFEGDQPGAAAAPPGWVVTPGVSVDTKAAFKGSSSLLMARSLEDAEKPCSAAGPVFAVAPGQWQIGLACKSDLHSPDNSYNAVVQLECLDDAGKVSDRITIADVFGRHDWQPLTRRVELPAGVASARFHAQLNKTYGSFWLDDLSAAYLAPSQHKDDRVSRVLFSTAQLGNLLFPADPRRVEITVETRKPLRDSQHTLSCVVRDYWGSEQMRPAAVPLGRAEKKGAGFAYQASIDLGGVPLEVGRYYELYAEVPREGDEPFRDYTSFAILPEAATKRYKPEEVPFTSRNWDNRLPEYIKLSDRLGVRVCGLWGGWSPKPPYTAEAPGLELCQSLGMGWLSNTPIASIEQGKEDYDETALREGVRHLIEQYGKVRPMVINLGNEPHGTGDRVLANVEAYRVVYDEVKKVDPSITVVATSVEPNEEYFKAGYGKYCDAYDFHIYETSDDVRRTLGEYKALARKYGQEKPIWSTELGLNSQGMTRQVVAVEVIKKFATFFAAGGTDVSWFGLLYPDPDAKDHGGSGDSHNIFDCRYNRYCPRLDAIAYYNAVNAIAVKKFAGEKQYAGGVRAFLFRDREGHALQVLWKDKGRQDVSVPLPGVKQVQLIRIDGSRRLLTPGAPAAPGAIPGVTLTIGEDPLLLLYDAGPDTLPAALGAPAATIDADPPAVARGAAASLTVTLDGAAADGVALTVPPYWVVKPSPATAPATGPGTSRRSSTTFTFTGPPDTSARQTDLTVTLTDPSGNRHGELYRRLPVSE